MKSSILEFLLEVETIPCMKGACRNCTRTMVIINKFFQKNMVYKNRVVFCENISI